MDDSRRFAGTFLVEPLERRLLLNGTLDPSFGTDGLVTFDFGVASQVAGAAVQRDGVPQVEKVIVAGRGFQLARFLPSGSLDTSFDVDGKVIPASLPPAASAEDVAVYADPTKPEFGKIVVVGTSNDPFAIPQVTLLQFNANGTPDTTFGAGGVATFQTHTITGGVSVGKAVTIDAAGRIVVAATSWNRSVQFQSLLRFLPNGTPDPDFGVVDGQFNFFFGAPGQALPIQECVALAIQPGDGKIVVAGIGQDTVGKFVLVRINPTGGLINRGDLDPTFGNGGKVITDFATEVSAPPPVPHHASTVGMALAPDKDIVLAGSVQGIVGPLETSGSNFAAARYEVGHINFRDGDLSPPFGLSFLPGRAVEDFESVNNVPAAIVIQPEPATSSHKIILAGGTSRGGGGGKTGSGGDFALLRLTAEGDVDGTFGNSGWVVTDFGSATVASDDGAAALLLTENETVTAVGHVRRGGGLRSIGLARYIVGNPDRDGDGVLNGIEDAHPDKLGTTEFGDGDANGQRDADQDRAASLPGAVAGAPYVTITSDPNGLRHVQAILGDATLRGATRPVGTFTFQIAGSFADVGFHLPGLPGALTDRFFAFGPTPDDPIPHWYDVPLAPVAGGPDLRFRVLDGGVGDSDHTTGVITVVGAPAKVDASALSITGSVFNDLDGDGLLDLAFPPEPALSGWRVFLDNGNGRWDAGEAWALSDDESAYAFVDDDTLAAGAFRQEPSNGGIETYVNLERRTYRVAAEPFDPQPGWISTLPPAYQSLDIGAGGRAFTHRVVTGDVDVDGDNDLIALAAQLDAVPARRIHVFRNRGDGSFDPVAGLSNLLDDANADDVVIGLFNNDSYPDIAVTSSTGALSLVDVYLADGQGGFLAPLNSAGMGDDLLLIAEAADMDEDGVLDLVIGTKHLLDDPNQTEKGRLGFLRGLGNGRFEPARTFSVPPEFFDVRQITELAVRDFTGDSHADVVTTMEGHASYQLWIGDGDGNLALK